MMFKTHLAFGFLVGLFSISHFHPSNQILFLVLVVFASILPDIDHPKSKLGKYFKPIGFLFEHRGFFHSLFVLPVIALLLYLLTKNFVYCLPILIGYSSHLITDMLTKEGIMPFHPLSRKAIRGFMYTGKGAEYILFIVLLVLDFWKLFNL